MGQPSRSLEPRIRELLRSGSLPAKTIAERLNESYHTVRITLRHMDGVRNTLSCSKLTEWELVRERHLAGRITIPQYRWEI